jgi:hypothetical protein
MKGEGFEGKFPILHINQLQNPTSFPSFLLQTGVTMRSSEVKDLPSDILIGIAGVLGKDGAQIAVSTEVQCPPCSGNLPRCPGGAILAHDVVDNKAEV